MARIEWVEHRLKNWALWHERGRGGGLGYAMQSSFLKEAASSGFRESRVPVDEIEAAITDEAVSSLKPDRKHLHETLQLFYLAGQGIRETARRARCAESTVHARLGQADAYLATWFADRKRCQEARALSLRQQLDAARPAKLQTVVLPERVKRRRAPKRAT